MTGEVDPRDGDERQPLAPHDRRRAAAPLARAAEARGRRARRCATCASPRSITSAWRSRASSSTCGQGRLSASPGSRATASRSSWRRSRARTPAPPAGSIALFGADMAKASAPRSKAQRACTSSPRSGSVAARSPRSRWRRTRCSRARPPSGGSDSCTSSAVTRLAGDLIRKFRVKARGPDAAAKSLSGGNLQKFIMGRELDAAPRLLLVSQPTWGVDVGAAAEIRGRAPATARRWRRHPRGQRGARRALRDHRPTRGDGARSHVALGRHARRDRRGDRAVWMSGLWPGAASPAGSPPGGNAHA